MCQLCQQCRFSGGPQVCCAFHFADNQFVSGVLKGNRGKSLEPGANVFFSTADAFCEKSTDTPRGRLTDIERNAACLDKSGKEV